MVVTANPAAGTVKGSGIDGEFLSHRGEGLLELFHRVDDHAIFGKGDHLVADLRHVVGYLRRFHLPDGSQLVELLALKR